MEVVFKSPLQILRCHTCHHTTVEKMYRAVCKRGVVLAVGHHNNRSTLFIQLCQQIHHLSSVLGVKLPVGSSAVSAWDWLRPHGLSPHAAADRRKAVAGSVWHGG